jgi:hypothetical protein
MFSTKGKTMTVKNDVVIIYFEDNPMGFARVEEILPDHKKNWYHIKLLMLHIPLQTVTWILKDIYIEGEEFTMNGNRMRIEKVVSPDEPDQNSPETPKEKSQGHKKNTGNAKVISLHDRK